jgi:hypothetical protein
MKLLLQEWQQKNVGLAPYLDTQRPEITFSQQAPYWCDVQTFEALIAKNRHQPQPDILALKKAVELYQGEFLEGFSQPDLQLFDDWMNNFRLRLDDLVWEALETIIRWSMKETADYKAGIFHAKRALTLSPWRESAHQYLMWLLASSDQRAAALTQYERCWEALKTWLDVDEPSATTEELYVNIREMKPATRPVTVPLPPLPPPAASSAPPFLAPLLPPRSTGLPGCRIVNKTMRRPENWRSNRQRRSDKLATIWVSAERCACWCSS